MILGAAVLAEVVKRAGVDPAGVVGETVLYNDRRSGPELAASTDIHVYRSGERQHG